jgi:FixJ family two-component response regulator/glycine cleavage system H lipoate-binding protein
MADNPALLVVDDEEVVCHACRRIFSRQGFQVESNTDARRGLELATEKDYGIILLDIKMPNMDGIQFLERLRQKKPDVPVLIITGYPSIPNAASAMRLGACDYVTKPFTTEEITRAVQRVLATHRTVEEEPVAEAGAESAASEILFWEESWFRLEADGSASVGAVLPGLRGGADAGIRLPRIGEAVYQGLPLAGVSVPGKPSMAVAAPLSGIVAAVNDELVQHPERLLSDPCGEGWIACVCATRYEDEVIHCKRRRLLLVNADSASAEEQAQKLGRLGCLVERAADQEGLLAALRKAEDMVVMFDATSLGENGPKLASLVNSKAATARIVVVAAPGGAWESTYRKEKIFYYAVEPFSDNEIADILAAAFRGPEAPSAKADRPKGPSEPISAITITNRNCHQVQLVAAPGLLWRNEGLGWQIGQRLLAQMFPVVITPGEANLTPASILKMASACDRLMVLLARDSGLLPGSLARDTKPEFGVIPGEAAGKVTIVSVEPDSMGGLASLDARTTAALADHLVQEMASY